MRLKVRTGGLVALPVRDAARDPETEGPDQDLRPSGPDFWGSEKIMNLFTDMIPVL